METVYGLLGGLSEGGARRRLSLSANDLLETDKSIVEIAFDYQFNNAETYSRAFKRLFRTLPSQWRRDGKFLPTYLQLPVCMNRWRAERLEIANIGVQGTSGQIVRIRIRGALHFAIILAILTIPNDCGIRFFHLPFRDLGWWLNR